MEVGIQGVQGTNTAVEGEMAQRVVQEMGKVLALQEMVDSFVVREGVWRWSGREGGMQAHRSGPSFFFFICAFPGWFLPGRREIGRRQTLAFSECGTENAWMDYRPRALESVLAAYVDAFAAVLLTGPRQAGKTTLLRHFARGRFGEDLAMVSFDTPSEVASFRQDPDLFFANRPGPLLLDEVQQVPDLFPYLKREVDRVPDRFRFLLSGSQHFPLMRGVTESLAGRAGVLELWPFACQEAAGAAVVRTLALLEHPERLEELAGARWPANDPDDLLPRMLRGGYPVPLLRGAGAPWFASYRQTYVLRDVRELSQVADLGLFDRFVVLAAARTGTIVNRSEVGRSLGIDDKTVERWFSLLETSYQGFWLPAWHGNATKRLVKRRKWVWGDSGLGLHLQALREPDTVLAAPHFGALFESFVLSEIRKLFGHAGLAWTGHHWRTGSGQEVDLVLPVGGRLVPIEVMHGASPRARAPRGLRAFRRTYGDQAPLGILISLHPVVEQVERGVWNLPLGLLLAGLPGNGPGVHSTAPRRSG